MIYYSCRWRCFAIVLGIFGVCRCAADADKMAHASLEPKGINGQAESVSRQWYALGYSPEKRQPIWVAYRMKREDTYKTVERKDRFRPDPQVSNSPDPWDYCGTDFNRGHMAPVNDMLYRYEAMDDSFYMSNMSPQYGHINCGVWKSIETFVHKAAERFGEVWVVSGPIFVDKGGPYAKIPIPGEDKVIKSPGGDIAVPIAFFKVIYTPARGGMSLAFIVPNTEADASDWRVYVRSVLIAEALTSFRFFADIDIDRSFSDITLWY